MKERERERERDIKINFLHWQFDLRQEVGINSLGREKERKEEREREREAVREGDSVCIERDGQTLSNE